MKKHTTLYVLARLWLLIAGLATIFTAQAQTTYSEPPDFPATSGATTYTFNQAGDYTFSGTVQTPNDQQDAFKVLIPTGFKITKAVLQASGGATQQQPTGFVSFADGYTGHSAATFNSSSGVNATQTGDLGPNSDANPYIGLTSVDFSVGTSWSIKITVVSTGGGSTCTNPSVPTVSATKTTICPGENTILSIQGGSLNSATTWTWYSGSCGGTPVGTGTQITVSPTTSTTYYVRGEGGCVTPGSCASQSITVNPTPTLDADLANMVSPTRCDTPNGQLGFITNLANGTYTVSYLSSISGSQTKTQSVVVTNTRFALTGLAGGRYYGFTLTSGGCTGTSSSTLSLNNAAPPLVSITPSSTTICAGESALLTASGAATYLWSTQQTSTTIAVTTTGTYSVTGTASTGCSGTALAGVTVRPLPPTPTLLTQSGQGYPGGQNNVTVDANTGTVNLVVGGCNGTITWSGPDNTSGNSSPILVATSQPGQFVYRTTCTTDGCTSPVASATVTVQVRLTVLHRDVDNYADNNAVQPLLQLQNNGTGALPYSALTLRYYLTVEGNSPLSNLSVNYAQVGSGNVRLRYVSLVPVKTDNTATPLPPARQGATGYVEVSFAEAAGSLAPGANSGNLQLYFAKSDYGSLYEPDDYSYAQVRDQLVNNPRITAYYNGVLVAGTEPGEVAANLAVQALTESKNGPSATQINTYLVLRNTGNVAIPFTSIRARYYFTSDNNQTARVELDEGEAAVRVTKLPAPVGGADSYVEVRYTGEGQLAPGASTGRVRYRVLRSDDGRFDQTNDYSYQEQPAELSPNNRVTVLIFNRLTWGTPPNGAPARMGVSEEPGSALSVHVLNNPVREDVVSVQVTGTGGAPLQLRLVNAQGRVVTQQQLDTPQVTTQHELSLSGQGPGVFLLQVSTPTQRQTIRVLKVD